jgi:hypothetical protein
MSSVRRFLACLIATLAAEVVERAKPIQLGLLVTPTGTTDCMFRD